MNPNFDDTNDDHDDEEDEDYQCETNPQEKWGKKRSKRQQATKIKDHFNLSEKIGLEIHIDILVSDASEAIRNAFILVFGEG